MAIGTLRRVLLLSPMVLLSCGDADDPAVTEVDPLLHASTTGGLVVVEREQEIGAPGVVYLDPEFSDDTLQVAFYIGASDVYLGRIDPATGLFVDHQYQHIGRAAPIVLTWNGPEFGASRHGTAVYYTGVDAGQKMHTFRCRNGEIAQLDSGDFHAVANYPSKNPNDASALVMGAVFSAEILADDKPWVVFDEDHPDDLRTFTMARIGKGPRFVPGRRQVTTNLRDRNGLLQAAVYDFASNRTSQLTFDGDDKDSAVMFAAPELGGEMLLFAVVNGGEAIRVYRKATLVWKPLTTIAAATGATLSNCQVLSFQDKTYFLVNETADGRANSDVTLISLAGARLNVGGSAQMSRFDPEGLVSGPHLFVYYYDVQSGRLFLSDVMVR